MSNQNQPYGVDISKHNGVVNFDKMATSKVRFIAMRSGMSWGYEDPQFVANMAGAKRIGLPRIIYHVPYFSEDARKQTDHIMRLLDKAGFDARYDRLAMDAELNNGMTKAGVTDKMAQILAILRTQTDRYPMIYSRASWVDVWLNVNALPTVDWWLAHYLKPNAAPAYTPEMKTPPALPKGVSTWLIHQTGEKGNGSEVGVASHYVDTNRWNGTEQDVRQYFGLEENSHEVYLPIIVKPEPEKEESMFRIKITTTPPNRYVTYDNPFGKQLPPAYWVASQSVHEVYETIAGWYRIGDKVWLNGNNVQWVKKLASDEITWVYYGAIYGQQDERWGDDVLGTKNRIKYQGCLLTANAMVCNHFEHFETPQTLNKWLTANRGYLDGNLFIWERLTEKYPDMISRTHIQKPTFLEMKKVLKSGDLPVIYVDMDDSTPQPEMHWLLGVGYTDTDIAAADPWTGTIVMLSEAYPTPPIRMGGYTKRK